MNLKCSGLSFRSGIIGQRRIILAPWSFKNCKFFIIKSLFVPVTSICRFGSDSLISNKNVSTNGRDVDTKSGVRTTIKAWGKMAEEIAENYKKGDTIQFLGRPIKVPNTAGATRASHMGYQAVYISRDKTLLQRAFELQERLISDNLSKSNRIEKEPQITGLSYEKRF